MANNKIKKLPSPAIAVMLSVFLCGLGQIYMRRTTRGLVLFLTFLCAIGIIWLGLYGQEFKVMDWGDNQLMFNPDRSINYRDYTVYVADIMKVTGSIQLVLTWFFGVIDARRSGRIR